MADYQHGQNDLITEVRPIRFDGLASCVYSLNVLSKRIFQGVSDGPMEVQNSLRDLKREKVIRSRSSYRLRKDQSLWIGFGSITDVMVKNILRSNPRKLVLGPNIDIHNSNVRRLFDEIPHSIFVVPSLWVQKFYIANLQMAPDRVKIWAAGIDSNKWKPSAITRDSVLIYVKGNFVDFASQLAIAMQKYGYKSVILKYGDYSQTEYFDLLNNSRFAIFLTGTESQGIAQFQSWSMNVPTLVLRRTKYRSDKLGGTEVEASSSPYLTSTTGRFFDGPHDTASVGEFLKDLDSFSPRFWVESRYSTSISSRNFLDLFN